MRIKSGFNGWDLVVDFPASFGEPEIIFIKIGKTVFEATGKALAGG